MAENDSLRLFRLNATVLENGIREYRCNPESSTNEVKVWTRQRSLADGVYLDKARSGELRVVKRVHLNNGSSRNPLSEVQMMSRVGKDSKHFVQFLGWFQTIDHVYFTMEYCPLGDISKCFPDPLPEAVVRELCHQLLQGLSTLHGMGITHRDIKPQNVMAMQDHPLWVKIGDFGISKHSLGGKTELRTRAGTEGYMAPEILDLLDSEREDSTYTCAVDIWSLGCVVYYALTKRSPFPDYRSLRDYCWGFSPFPESLLTDTGMGSTGIQCVKMLMALRPEDRPSASTDWISSWTLEATNGSCHTEVTKDDNPVELLSLREQSSLCGLRDFAYSEPVSSLGENVMDMNSLDLWHTLTDVNSDPRRVQLLLDRGADPNNLHSGYTALHLAAQQGPLERIQILLRYLADPSIRTQPHRETPLHLATCDDKNLPKLRLLVERCEIDAQTVDGDTVLHLAILRYSQAEPISFLLEHGAYTEIRGRAGQTALQYAICLNQEEKARVILNAGADPNVKDAEGRTPLHQAAASSRIGLNLVQELVEKGARVDEQDFHHRTALYEAVKRKKRDIINFLVESGAKSELLPLELQGILRRELFLVNVYSGFLGYFGLASKTLV